MDGQEAKTIITLLKKISSQLEDLKIDTGSMSDGIYAIYRDMHNESDDFKNEEYFG